MATIKEIPRTRLDGDTDMALYQIKLSLSGAEESSVFEVPLVREPSFSLMSSFGLVVQITNYQKEDVESDNAVWLNWDGISKLNNAITYIRFINQEDDNEVMFTVKGGV